VCTAACVRVSLSDQSASVVRELRRKYFVISSSHNVASVASIASIYSVSICLFVRVLVTLCSCVRGVCHSLRGFGRRSRVTVSMYTVYTPVHTSVYQSVCLLIALNGEASRLTDSPSGNCHTLPLMNILVHKLRLTVSLYLLFVL